MLQLLTRLLGSRNDRIVRSFAPDVRAAKGFETALEALSDDALRAKTERVPRPPEAGRVARLDARRGVRRRARGRQARHEDAPLRRAAHRRHHPASGQDRRDAHRRRQDAGRDAARLPQCPHRRGRPRRHGERVPGPARRGLDGPALQLPGPDRRRHQELADARKKSAPPTACDITYGTNNEFGFDYLRDNLAFRLGRSRAARARLRHRRRGRLDPDRRSAHAAHHQRPGGREHRALPRHQQARAAPHAAEGGERPRRLLRRREAEAGSHHRRRPRARRAADARSGPAAPG